MRLFLHIFPGNNWFSLKILSKYYRTKGKYSEGLCKKLNNVMIFVLEYNFLHTWLGEIVFFKIIQAKYF